MPNELLLRALERRFKELLETRITSLAPADFGEMSAFVSEVRSLFSGTLPRELANPEILTARPQVWGTSELDCLSSLRHLALGEAGALLESARPPLESFIDQLRLSNSEQRFDMLTDRYRFPANFGLESEDACREWVLMRLMVQDRALVERESIALAASDEVLLRLNLVALYAVQNDDLRFLDALNYYYELLPSSWHPARAEDWLLVSYFAFYARALAAFISRS